jgi:hypothetical protein
MCLQDPLATPLESLDHGGQAWVEPLAVYAATRLPHLYDREPLLLVSHQCVPTVTPMMYHHAVILPWGSRQPAPAPGGTTADRPLQLTAGRQYSSAL